MQNLNIYKKSLQQIITMIIKYIEKTSERFTQMITDALDRSVDEQTYLNKIIVIILKIQKIHRDEEDDSSLRNWSEDFDRPFDDDMKKVCYDDEYTTSQVHDLTMRKKKNQEDERKNEGDLDGIVGHTESTNKWKNQLLLFVQYMIIIVLQIRTRVRIRNSRTRDRNHFIDILVLTWTILQKTDDQVCSLKSLSFSIRDLLSASSSLDSETSYCNWYF